MSALLQDQASRLRTLAKDLDVSSRTALIYNETPRQIFDFMMVSGKRGVGKTTLAISFAVALAQWGKKVLLIDLDFSSNAFPLYFDQIVDKGIYDLLVNDISIKDLIYTHETGVEFIANHVDLITDVTFSKANRTRLINAIDRIRGEYDYVIADSQGGISQNTLISSELAKKLLYVTTTDPISVIDTYSLVKYLSPEEKKQEFEILVNMVSSEKVFKESKEKLDTALNQFLLLHQTDFHKIEYSKLLHKRVQSQELTQDKDKYHSWAKALRKLTKRIVS